MATEAQRTLLRLDLGLDDDETVFTNDAVDLLYTRATTKHAGDDDLIEAWAKVLGARQIRAKAMTLTDYDQGDSAEKLSQVFKHADTLVKAMEAEYSGLAASSGTPMRYSKLRGHTTRRVEYPDA